MKGVLTGTVCLAVLAAGDVGWAQAAQTSAAQATPAMEASALPPKPSAFAPGDCDTPAKREQVLASLESDEGGPGAYPRALSKHYEALMTRKLDRLARAARWSEARKAEFVLGMFEDPRLAGVMEKTVKRLEPVFAGMDAIVAEPDEAKQCRILVGVVERVLGDPDLEADAAAQWKAMESVIDAEAARLGVKLD